MPEPGGAEAGPAYERLRLLASSTDELVWLRWSPGVESAIHDHGGADGVVILVSGVLCERIYAPTQAEPALRSERVHRAPAFIRVAPATYHTMESVGPWPARSLHLYRGATTLMHVYDPSRGGVVTVAPGTRAQLPVDPATIVPDPPRSPR
jgi:predicted metal-dependent enzyme (double-stranded beta helix superfamily)